MPAYAWTCFACGASNSPGPAPCPGCACPASASVADLLRHRKAFQSAGGVLSPKATHLHEPPELWGLRLLLVPLSALLWF
jgi:hypothetical protein